MTVFCLYDKAFLFKRQVTQIDEVAVINSHLMWGLRVDAMLFFKLVFIRCVARLETVAALKVSSELRRKPFFPSLAI